LTDDYARAALGNLNELLLNRLGKLLVEDLVAQPDALVADVHGGAPDELAHLLLRLAAERALQQISGGGWSRHPTLLPKSSQRTNKRGRALGDSPKRRGE